MRAHPSCKTPTLLALLFISLTLLYLSLENPNPNPNPLSRAILAAVPATAPRHLLFGIASSAKSFPRRHDYLRLWFRPNLTRGLLFLDSPPSTDHGFPIHISANTSGFPYTFPGGLRSAVRVARIVKELLDVADVNNVRWIVLGDDDTVFFPDNLVATLGKYDWEEWYYVGGRSEIVDQNIRHSFGMAFGGGGIAISYSLARVLARVIDSCLVRYGHVYGSDDRVAACLAELGVGLTHEPGFHQVDLRGDLLGMLSAHPLVPVVSLHHLDNVDPLFPGMNRSAALKHLFKAVNIDTGRVLQQTVCYDRMKLRTISVSWGYAVQVFEGNQLLPDLLSLPQTFNPWKRSRNISSSLYMFNTREIPRDRCKRPAVFYMESVFSNKNGIESNYSRYVSGNCIPSKTSTKNLRQIRVHTQQLSTKIGQVQRRHCCDVLSSSSEVFMEIAIRKCRDSELIAM